MLEVRINAGEKDAFARILGILESLDIERAWPRIVSDVIHPFMISHSKNQFATQGAHGGRPWAGYGSEPKYAAYKKAKVGHLTVLRWQKGGTYERLFPSLTDPRHPDHYYRVGRSSVAIGTLVEHAVDLTKNTTGPQGEPSPARDILAMTGGQAKGLVTMIQRHIRIRAGQAGLTMYDVRSNL